MARRQRRRADRGATPRRKAAQSAEQKSPARHASGGPSTTVITHRTYLTDARFIVVLSGDPSVLQTCAAALADPKWGVWFGRKSCLPASPLFPTLAENRQAAMDELMRQIQKVSSVKLVSGQEQVADDGSWYQSDEPISFGKREFRSRPIRRTHLNT